MLIVFSLDWRSKSDLSIFISFLFSISSAINLYYSYNYKRSKSLKISPYTHSAYILILMFCPGPAIPDCWEGEFCVLVYTFSFHLWGWTPWTSFDEWSKLKTLGLSDNKMIWIIFSDDYERLASSLKISSTEKQTSDEIKNHLQKLSFFLPFHGSRSH